MHETFNPFLTPSSHLTPSPLQVEAHRRLSLAHLPVVLILHLKRFLFDKTGGSQKLQKQVQYSTQLEVGKGERGACLLLGYMLHGMG